MKLIFLYGLPGVGKLTVARELAKLTGSRIFHNHLVVDLVDSVFEFGSEPFVELREAIWLAVFSKAVATELDCLIFTFAFDRTVQKSFIGNVQSVVEGSGRGEILFVQLTCSPEELERRIAHPSRKKFSKLNSVRQFRELRESGAFIEPGIPPGQLVVDTTELPAVEAAELIAGKLGLQRI
jgi:adenylate kinase